MPHAVKRRDRLIGLFVAGAVLLNPPILTLFSGGSVLGWPSLFVYLFGVWALLIAGLAIVLERRPEIRNDSDKGGLP
jgi:hypothetical protein